MIAVFDTNILIDHLRNIPHAKLELKRYDERAISLVTWIEVMVGANGQDAEMRSFLTWFEVLDIDRDVAERAAVIRRAYRVKLPDAIVWATAQAYDLVLGTRNTKDFPADDPGVHVPYSLG